MIEVGAFLKYWLVIHSDRFGSTWVITSELHWSLL